MTDSQHAPSKKVPTDVILRFFSSLPWFAIWPIVMLIPGVLALIATSLIFYGWIGIGDSPEGGPLGSYYLTFIWIMTITCLLLVWLLRKTESIFLRMGRMILFFYTVSGLLTGSLLVANIPDQTISGNPSVQQGSIIVPDLSHDPIIIQRLNEIGVSDEAILANSSQQYVEAFTGDEAILSEQGGLFRSFTSPIDGSFSYGELKIKSGFSAEAERRIIAHEYLHYVWSSTVEKDQRYQDRLTSELITLYGKDEQMQRRTAEYSINGLLQPTELFAYYCTESSDGYLSAYVREECGKYINRKSLVMQR